MKTYIVEIDDEKRGRDRKIYFTSWGTSAWSIHAKEFEKEEAEQKYNAIYCSLEELLKKSDFVCIMTPLTPSTEKMMGKREFELMKNTAIFINGSRGKTVDEEALIYALKTNVSPSLL